MAKELNLIHIYTGKGKGKTTAVLGIALRSIGYNHKIALVQFLKAAKKYGEIISIEKYLKKNIEIFRFGKRCVISNSSEQDCNICFLKFKYLPCHLNLKNPDKKDLKEIKNAWKKSKELIKSKKFKIVILDEILFCLSYNLLVTEEVINFLRNNIFAEIILTGRANKKKLNSLFAIADYITEMKEIKHPYKKGVVARKGIEY